MRRNREEEDGDDTENFSSLTHNDETEKEKNKNKRFQAFRDEKREKQGKQVVLNDGGEGGSNSRAVQEREGRKARQHTMLCYVVGSSQLLSLPSLILFFLLISLTHLHIYTKT